MTLKPTLLAAAKEKQSVMAGACIETVCWAYCSTHSGDPGCCWMWGHNVWVQSSFDSFPSAITLRYCIWDI